MKRIYTSNNGQTIFDAALMQYGSLEGLQFLLEDNPALIQNDGTIEQFGVDYLVRNTALDERMKDRMIEVVPTTGGKVSGEGIMVVISDGFGDVISDGFGDMISGIK